MYATPDTVAKWSRQQRHAAIDRFYRAVGRVTVWTIAVLAVWGIAMAGAVS